MSVPSPTPWTERFSLRDRVVLLTGAAGESALTKGAIKQFTQVSAAEWAADRVRVNCIAPGFIHTPLTAEALWADEKRRAWILDRVSISRQGQPNDLVGALLFLASDASAFVKGQTLPVDGGFTTGGSWDRQGPVGWQPDTDRARSTD